MKLIVKYKELEEVKEFHSPEIEKGEFNCLLTYCHHQGNMTNIVNIKGIGEDIIFSCPSANVIKVEMV